MRPSGCARARRSIFGHGPSREHRQGTLLEGVAARNVVSSLALEPGAHALKGRYWRLCIELHAVAGSCNSLVSMRYFILHLVQKRCSELHEIIERFLSADEEKRLRKILQQKIDSHDPIKQSELRKKRFTGCKYPSFLAQSFLEQVSCHW